MIYFLFFFIIVFIFFNYKIIYLDYKIKKIPNEYLGYLLGLLPFYYIYIFFNFPGINYSLFFFQIFITFLISFLLYNFGIWAAGDAKYLLVLALFIPFIGIVPFVGNIALITFIYLFIYFIYFYLVKVVKYKTYRENLIQNIKIDLEEKWKTYKKDKTGNNITIILKWLVIFLIIFVLIRLIRLYLFKYLFDSPGQSRILILVHYFEKYNIYLVFFIIGIILGIIYLIRKLISKIKLYFQKKNKDSKKTKNIVLTILAISLIIFIITEYYYNPYELKGYLIRIFTIYIFIYIMARIFIYSYKVTFILGETKFKNINKLSIGDFVDKTYLSHIFGNQKCLGACGKKQNNDLILFPNPNEKILQIKNPLQAEDVRLIKNIYKITNSYHKENKTKDFQEIIDIKTLKTFSFAPYILFGFFITFVFGNKIWELIINLMYKIIGI